MKKRILCFGILLIMILTLNGCGNKKIFDMTYTFKKAIIEMPSGDVLELEIQNWRDFEDGDQLQIKATDGNTYLVHSSKCVLMVK